MLLLILLTAPSHACSCASLHRASIESCQDSSVVYGGRVAGYQWPSGPSALSEEVRVGLQVDRVWKGQVSERVFTHTGWGGGDCGIHPAPGTPFVVCENEASTPHFRLCDAPALGEQAEALMLAFGDGAAPSPWKPPERAHQVQVALEKMRPAAIRSTLLFFISMLVGLGSRRIRAPKDRPKSWTIAATLAVLAMLGCWLFWCEQGQSYWSYTNGPSWGLGVTSALLGAVLGRSSVSGPLRAALSLLVLVSLALALLPKGRDSMVWDLEQVTCNTQRAQGLLQDQGDLESTYNAWRDEPPKTCGEQNYWPRQIGTQLCLSFEDDNGGRTTLCGEEANAREHRFATPRRLKRPPPFKAP